MSEDAASLTDEPLVRRHTDAVRAAARLAKVAGSALGDAQLTLPQYRVLVFLDGGPRPATEVATLIGVTPSTVTSMVDGLTARNLVLRTPDSADRRRVMLSLTEQGRTSLARGDDVVAERLEIILGYADPADAERVLDGLEVLKVAMDLALADHLVESADPTG